MRWFNGSRGVRAPLWLVCSIGLVLAGCAAPTQTERAGDVEGDRDAVIQAHEALMQAYQSGNVEAFIGMLEPSSELLIFHPRLESRFDGIDEVRQSLPRMFARVGSATWSDLHAMVVVRGDVAWLTSHVLVESPKVAEPFAGRGTEIWVRKGNGWKLAHGHWSHNPEAGAPAS